MSAPRIAVLGGGLAGISAALRCADAGAEVVLLEVRRRLGGAAYSFSRDGLELDNGQHVFLRCCTGYVSLLRRLGVEDRTILQRRLDVPVLGPGGRAGRLRRRALPVPLHLAGALARYPFLGAAERVRAATAAMALARVDPDDPAADARTFASWLAEHGQTPRAIDALWDVVGRPTLNLAAADASLAQAAFVFQEGLLHDAPAADIGWSRGPLSALHDQPARDALRRAGVDVRLGCRAERVGTGPAGVEVAAGAAVLAADAVVVALPHGRVAGVLGTAGPDPRALEALGHSPIVNLHVHYDRPVLDLPFAAGVGTPVQYVFDRTASSGAARGQLLSVSLSAADREVAMPAEALRAEILPALAALLPAAGAARVLAFHAVREHAATFRAAPGSRALRAGARCADERLVLAGAWTDTGWPATMEGAVRSGRTAADRALRAASPAPDRTAVPA